MREFWNDHRLLDTLRLGPEEYTRILDLLYPDGNHRGAEHRRSARWRFWTDHAAVLVHRPDGSEAPYAIKPHNISARGLAFLHGFFLQIGTPCDLALRTLRKVPQILPGRVARCRHVTGKVHEIGVEFREACDLRLFLADYDGTLDGGEPNEAPPQFKGQLLCVNDSVDDRELIEYLVERLGVGVHCATTAQEAIDQLEKDAFDVVLIQRDLPGGSATLARRLRNQKFAGFIVAVVPTGSDGIALEACQDTDGEHCYDCVLAAPITLGRLIDLFRGFLPGEWSEQDGLEPLISLHWNNVDMRPLIMKFVGRLEGHVRELHGLLNTEGTDTFRKTCIQLISSAESYGYKSIATQMRELVELVEQGVPHERLKCQMAELDRLCAAARLIKT